MLIHVKQTNTYREIICRQYTHSFIWGLERNKEQLLILKEITGRNNPRKVIPCNINHGKSRVLRHRLIFYVNTGVFVSWRLE